jgi:hypothetical protein
MRAPGGSNPSEPLNGGSGKLRSEKTVKTNQKEVLSMKSFSWKAGVVGITIAFAAISFSFAAQAAEKKNFIFSKKSVKNISSINLNAPQDKNNEIVQWVRQDSVMEHTDSNLIGGEITVYGTTDRLTYGGILNATGYDVLKSKGGDFLYYKWQATGLLTDPDEKNWKWDIDRKIQFIGGTGTYRNLKGSGTCKGKFTPAGNVEKCEGEWQY